MSKHPTLVQRGKSTASSIGHVVRNIGSPYLWDGGSSTSSKEKGHSHSHSHGHRDRERERDRGRNSDSDKDRRRKSLPHSHHLSAEYEEDAPSPRLHPRQAALSSRRASAANSPMSDKEHWDSSGSPRPTPTERHHHRRTSSPSDHTIRHSKSHDPTPSPREYFPPYDSYGSRRGSAQPDAQSPAEGSGAEASKTPPPPSARTASRERERARERERERDMVHTGFMPTASPLFATQVARSDYRQAPRGSGRERYDSPSTSPMGRTTSMRRDASGRRDSARPTGSSPPNMGSPRPKVTRFETPVSGTQSRQYARDGGGYR